MLFSRAFYVPLFFSLYSVSIPIALCVGYNLDHVRKLCVTTVDLRRRRYHERTFWEHLENTGLFKAGSVDHGKVEQLSLTELADIAEMSAEITSAEHAQPRSLLICAFRLVILGR